MRNLDNKENEIYEEAVILIDDYDKEVKESLFNFLSSKYTSDIRISNLEITTNFLKKRIIEVTTKDNNFNFSTDYFDYEETLKEMFLYNIKQKKLGQILFKIGDRFDMSKNTLPDNFQLEDAYNYLGLLKDYEELTKHKVLSKEIINKLSEIEKETLSFASKYEIDLSDESLGNKKLEEILTNENKTVSEYDYLDTLAKYLKDLSKKNNPKKKYTMFIKQPITKKVTIAYTEFLYSRLLNSFFLNKKGPNELKLSIKEKQEKNNNLKVIEEGIFNYEATEEEKDYYLKNVVDIEINEEDLQDKYVLSDIKRKITCLNFLSQKEDNKQRLATIDFSISFLKDWLIALNFINEKEYYKAYLFLDMKIDSISQILTNLKEKTIFSTEDKALLEVIFNYQKYFEVFSKKLNNKHYVDKALQVINNLNDYKYFLDIVDNLKEPSYISTIYDYENLIKYYFEAFNLLKNNKLSKDQKTLLENKIEDITKIFPKEFTVKLQEDRVEIPKKYFKN